LLRGIKQVFSLFFLLRGANEKTKGAPNGTPLSNNGPGPDTAFPKKHPRLRLGSAKTGVILS
jgi:hypothetical protein